MEKRKAATKTEPLVVMEQKCSYLELIRTIQQIFNVPSEISHTIGDFFVVESVIPSKVKAIRSSSTSNQHPLSAALDDDISTWWISGPGSMPRGKGREYIEFQLSSRSVCRLSKFSIQIPPLPMGPLSVRRLRLERRVETRGGDTVSSGCWQSCSPIWTIENKTGWQEYALEPPVDVQSIRVVCLTNQMEVILHGLESDDEDMENQFSCVGFYCVKFE